MDLKLYSVIKLRMKFNQIQSKRVLVDASKRLGEVPTKDAGRNIRPTEGTQRQTGCTMYVLSSTISWDFM